MVRSVPGLPRRHCSAAPPKLPQLRRRIDQTIEISGPVKNRRRVPGASRPGPLSFSDGSEAATGCRLQRSHVRANVEGMARSPRLFAARPCARGANDAAASELHRIGPRGARPRHTALAPEKNHWSASTEIAVDIWCSPPAASRTSLSATFPLIHHLRTLLQ